MKKQVCTVCHHIGKPKTRFSGKKVCRSCGAGPVIPASSPRGLELTSGAQAIPPRLQAAEGAKAASSTPAGALASWFFGVVFLLMALAELTKPDGGVLPALVMLMMAGLCLPPVRRFVHKKTGKTMTTGARFAITFGLICLWGVASGQTGTPAASTTVSKGDGTASAGNSSAPAPSPAPAPAKAASPFDDPDTQQAWIYQTKQIVRDSLKDPASAEFRNLFFVKFKNGPLVCGEVNSKNGFGGYTGFQHFLSNGVNVTAVEEQVPDFNGLWNRTCAKGH